MKIVTILFLLIIVIVSTGNIGSAYSVPKQVSSNSISLVDLLADNFNDENGGIPELDYANFTNWDVSDGTFDLIGNGSFDFFPQNGLYVDLDGSTENPGILKSKADFTLERGIYYLQFDIAGSQRGDINTVTVRLANVFSEQFTLESNEPFLTINRTIIVTEPITGHLSFELTAGGGDNVGLILDEVKLSVNLLSEILYLPHVVK